MKQLHIWLNLVDLIHRGSYFIWKNPQDYDLHHRGGTLQISNHTYRKDRCLAELIFSITCLQGSLRNSSIDYKITSKGFW